MEYRNLYYFVSIVRNKNYSKAAEKINVSQSALSRAVQSLEDEFNVQLIRRSTRSFELTSVGESFFAAGEKIVKDFESLQTEMKNYTDSHVEHIHLGIPSVLDTIMAPLFADLFQRYSLKIKLDMEVAGSKVLAEKVLDGSLNLALVMKAPDEHEFDIYPVFSEGLVAVLWPEHSLAQRDKLEISELKDELFILLDNTFQLHENVVDMCKEANFEPNILQLSPSWDYIATMVSMRQGISIFPGPILKKLPFDLVGVPLTGMLAEWNIVVISKTRKKLSANTKKFIKYLQEYYFDL